MILWVRFKFFKQDYEIIDVKDSHIVKKKHFKTEESKEAPETKTTQTTLHMHRLSLTTLSSSLNILNHLVGTDTKICSIKFSKTSIFMCGKLCKGRGERWRGVQRTAARLSLCTCGSEDEGLN